MVFIYLLVAAIFAKKRKCNQTPNYYNNVPITKGYGRMPGQNTWYRLCFVTVMSRG